MHVTGPQYDPLVMDHQIPDHGCTGPPTAWLTRAGTSSGCRHRGHGLTTPARAADDDLQIKELAKQLGKKAADVEREALTAMRSARFDRARAGADSGQGRYRYGDGDDGHQQPRHTSKMAQESESGYEA